MPSLDGATEWLNTEPLGPAELRGHVVIVNFWTLTCINWLRTEPYVRAWSRAYRDDGLIVVGVHTPEFAFERDLDLVQTATAEREIEYPVALDSRYSIWNAFDNHFWPALYFIDREGVVRENDFGEGGYERDERIIQELLGIRRDPVPVSARGIEAEADWDHLKTPETYLGFGRGSRFASPDGVAFDQPRAYSLPDQLPPNHWALAGSWAINQESASARGERSSIAFRFHARDAHIVLSPGTAEPVPFRVTLDGGAPGSSHGIDVDEGGTGVLSDGRLYQLIRTHGIVRERTVSIEFLGSGAEAYVFTFG
jgi:thiol-disulfide isomerase/thioredoxin